MGRRTKQGVVATAVGALALFGMATAGALPWQQQGNEPRTPAAPKIVTPTVSEGGFVAVNPCRLADTRAAVGAIAAGTSRSFTVRGTTQFVPQGGHSGGCGIPTGASSVDISITTVSPQGSGFVRAYPTGGTPDATILNFAKDQSISVTTEIKLASSSQAKPLSLKVFGSTTDVVIDVVGYHAPPMTAYVSSSGVLQGGSRVLAASHPSTGNYSVNFDRDVSACSFQVTPYAFNYTVAVGPEINTPTAVHVYVHEQVGATTAHDTSFFMTVTC